MSLQEQLAALKAQKVAKHPKELVKPLATFVVDFGKSHPIHGDAGQG